MKDMAYSPIKRVLISINHPAQYHFFKHTIHRLQEIGIEVITVIKTKDILEQLLNNDGFSYINIQKTMRKDDKLSILVAALQRSWAVIRIALKQKPDLFIGTGADVAHAGWLLRKPCITTLEDDVDIISNLARMTYPFTRDILVPRPCKVGKWERKKIGYAGYMKLAYLHPNLFTPDEEVVKRYGIDSKYIIIRAVKLTAYHDIHVKGLNLKLIDQIISMATQLGYRVCINAECQLPAAYQTYLLPINPSDMHHLMSYASLLISDSQSMSVEAALLGTPNLRFSDFAGKISVLEELEQLYELTCGIPTSQPEQLLDKARQILINPQIREQYAIRRSLLLSEKIDVTAFLTWFITNYPESRNIMKSNPSYQFRFK